MKFRNFRNLGLLLIGAATITSCSDDNATNSEPEYQGDLVSFGILDEDAENAPQGISLKTVYGDKNGNTWAIKWVNGDSVRINKHTGDVQSAIYTVTKTADETRGTLTLGANQNGLTWTEKPTGNEYFTVVYPFSATEKPATSNDKSVTVSYSKGESLWMTNDGHDNFTSEIKMENLRMLGYVDTEKTRSPIDFKLNPVSSTFEVVVKGPSSGTSYLTGITVIVDNDSSFIDKDYKVKYLYDNTKKRFVAQKSNNASKEARFTYNVNYDDGHQGNNGYVELGSGKTAKFTVFIPGIWQASGKCRVQLNFAGFSKTMKVNKVIPANSRTKLTTPAFTYGGDNVPWITPLDDDVLISSMSIPGTKFASLYEWWGGSRNNVWQEKDIPQQWAYGIRAFHISQYEYYGTLWPRYRTGGSWYSSTETTEVFLNRLVDLLSETKYKDEFAIVISHQGEGDTSKEYAAVDALYKKYKDRGKAADFTPNMTIADARGKILFLHDDGNTLDVGGKMTGWPAINEGTGITNTRIQSSKGSATLSLYVADEDIQSTKHFINFEQCRGIVKQNIEKSGTDLWKITDISTHSPDRNRQDYEHGMFELNRFVHSVIYQHKGQAGIVLCQLVGRHTVTYDGGKEPIYGDIIVPTLINKNYRYPLKKK